MTPADSGVDGGKGVPAGAQRLDKWLWFARVVKSRTLAASLVTAGKVRINKVRAEKPSQTVKAGDVVTSSIKKSVRVLRVKAVGLRRGPASEAAELYEDLTPPPAKPAYPAADRGVQFGHGARPPGSGRPTKRERRSIDRLQDQE